MADRDLCRSVQDLSVGSLKTVSVSISLLSRSWSVDSASWRKLGDDMSRGDGNTAKKVAAKKAVAKIRTTIETSIVLSILDYHLELQIWYPFKLQHAIFAW